MKKAIMLLLALVLVVGFAGCGKSEAVARAENLIAQIGEVSLDSLPDIAAAEEAVAMLTDEEKAELDNIDVLNDAKVKYQELENSEKANKIDNSIAAIGEVSLDSESAISAARSAYDAASADIKDMVKKYDILTAAEQKLAKLQEEKRIEQVKEKASAVADKIARIGEVTLESEELLASIRKEYEALNDEEKTYLSNADILYSAEETFKQLKQEEQNRIINELSSKFKVENDKVRGITWYTPKSMPKYIDTRSYIIPYIGVMDSDGSAWICVRYNYTADSWIFWKKLTIVVDGEKYYKNVGYRNVIRDNDTEIWEYYDESLPVKAGMDNEDIQMLSAISESKETIIRFEGDDYYDDLIVKDVDKTTIKETLALYKALIGK